MTTRQLPVALPASTIAAGNLPGGNGYGVYRDWQSAWHWALDIANPVGADVVSPEDGVVVNRWDDNTTAPFAGYGPGGVLVRGASGWFHLLAHMNASVAVGDRVSSGEVVGHTGELPRGSHCHWEVRRLPIDSPATRGANTINPIAWLVGADGATSRWLVVLGVAWLVSRLV